jgi:hypothetical protein
MQRFFLLLLLPLCACAQTTHYERSGARETPRLAETLDDCRALAASSPWFQLGEFGRSPQGRPLALLILDRDRQFRPAAARAAGKAVLLIQGCIHAGEPDGKDAGLLFLRDLVTRQPELLEGLTILFMPVFNADGHERFGPYNRINQNGPTEMGWRSTARNLNLNRDYLKADSAEMQAWLQVQRDWQPDFLIDCHVTDGADYQYPITYGMDTGHFTESRLGAWMETTYLAELTASLERQGIPTVPYVQFRKWHDPRSGLLGGAAGPMYSTGYQAARNRPAILLETHMLKPYPVRVAATRATLLATTAILHRERASLLRLNRQADAFTASRAFREQPMALAFEPTGVSEPLAFKGFEYTVEKSGLTGGDWFTYDPSRPALFQIPYFKALKISASVRLPEAYLIPVEWTEVIARLDAHGIRYRRLSVPATVRVESYRFGQPRWSSQPVEGRMKLRSFAQETETGERSFPAGSALVPTDQATARLIAHLLEPASDDSLFRWGFFNSVLEQTEYGESYVLEPLAREMLAGDPALAAAFAAAKAKDPAFAADPEAMLNWFFLRSRYQDRNLNRYPVGRILDGNQLRGLLK